MPPIIVRSDAPDGFPTSVLPTHPIYRFSKRRLEFPRASGARLAARLLAAFRRSSLPFVRRTRARTGCRPVYFNENRLTTVVSPSFFPLLFLCVSNGAAVIHSSPKRCFAHDDIRKQSKFRKLDHLIRCAGSSNFLSSTCMSIVNQAKRIY